MTLSQLWCFCGIGLESRNLILWNWARKQRSAQDLSKAEISSRPLEIAMADLAEHGAVLKWEYCVTYQDDLRALPNGSFLARHWRECNHLQNNSFSAVYWRTRASRDTSPARCYPAIFKASGYKSTKYNLVEVLSLLSSFQSIVNLNICIFVVYFAIIVNLNICSIYVPIAPGHAFCDD